MGRRERLLCVHMTFTGAVKMAPPTSPPTVGNEIGAALSRPDLKWETIPNNRSFACSQQAEEKKKISSSVDAQSPPSARKTVFYTFRPRVCSFKLAARGEKPTGRKLPLAS